MSLPMRSSTLVKMYRRLNEILLINRGVRLIDGYGDPAWTLEAYREENFRHLHGAFNEFRYYRDLLRNSTR